MESHVPAGRPKLSSGRFKPKPPLDASFYNNPLNQIKLTKRPRPSRGAAPRELPLEVPLSKSNPGMLRRLAKELEALVVSVLGVLGLRWRRFFAKSGRFAKAPA